MFDEKNDETFQLKFENEKSNDFMKDNSSFIDKKKILEVKSSLTIKNEIMKFKSLHAVEKFRHYKKFYDWIADQLERFDNCIRLEFSQKFIAKILMKFHTVKIAMKRRERIKHVRCAFAHRDERSSLHTIFYRTSKKIFTSLSIFEHSKSMLYLIEFHSREITIIEKDFVHTFFEYFVRKRACIVIHSRKQIVNMFFIIVTNSFVNVRIDLDISMNHRFWEEFDANARENNIHNEYRSTRSVDVLANIRFQMLVWHIIDDWQNIEWNSVMFYQFIKIFHCEILSSKIFSIEMLKMMQDLFSNTS